MPLQSAVIRSRRPHTGFPGRTLLLLTLLAFASGAAADNELPLYFEWGPPLHDFLDLGGIEIDPYEVCSNASGGLAVDGFDMIGEWIETLFALPEAGRYNLEASFKSYSGVHNVLALSVRPAAGGAAQSLAISYYGAGTG